MKEYYTRKFGVFPVNFWKIILWNYGAVSYNFQRIYSIVLVLIYLTPELPYSPEFWKVKIPRIWFTFHPFSLTRIASVTQIRGGL